MTARRAYDEVEHSRVRPADQLAGLPLAFQAPAPSVPVATSEATAAKLDTKEGRRKCEINRQRILRALVSRGPMTADALEVATGLSGNTIRPRLKDLRDLKYVAVSDDAEPTRTGSPARLVCVTAAGRDAVRAVA